MYDVLFTRTQSKKESSSGGYPTPIAPQDQTINPDGKAGEPNRAVPEVGGPGNTVMDGGRIPWKTMEIARGRRNRYSILMQDYG
jgi:hypothetical protein